VGERSKNRICHWERSQRFCLVDLSTRIETLDGVALVSAVDLMARRGATLSHVGLGQPCVVLFARDDHTWTYLVDSKGRLYSVAVGESLEWAWHFWETGRQSEKMHPTAKLLDGIDETELSDCRRWGERLHDSDTSRFEVSLW
jgi:hypothetical protein